MYHELEIEFGLYMNIMSDLHCFGKNLLLLFVDGYLASNKKLQKESIFPELGGQFEMVLFN